MEGQVEEWAPEDTPAAEVLDSAEKPQKPRKLRKKGAADAEGRPAKQRRKAAEGEGKAKKKRKPRRESAAEWELPPAGQRGRRQDPLEPYRQQLKDELMERFRDKMPKEFDGYFKREDPWELGPLIPQLQLIGLLPTPWPAVGEEE